MNIENMEIEIIKRKAHLGLIKSQVTPGGVGDPTPGGVDL